MCADHIAYNGVESIMGQTVPKVINRSRRDEHNHPCTRSCDLSHAVRHATERYRVVRLVRGN